MTRRDTAIAGLFAVLTVLACLGAMHLLAWAVTAIPAGVHEAVTS